MMASSINLTTVWAFIGGLIASWLLSGAQGENTWWMILATIGAFYFLTQRKKKTGMTMNEAISEIVRDNKGRSRHLDPTAVDVKREGENYYLFDFYKDAETFEWRQPIVGGLQGVTPRSIESLHREQLSTQLELKQDKPRMEDDQ